MKYIATIKNISKNNKTIRVYADTKKKVFVIKIKESGYRTEYIMKEQRFSKLNNYDLDLFEQLGIHAYFSYNKNELESILSTINELKPDILRYNLKELELDINREGYIAAAMGYIEQTR